VCSFAQPASGDTSVNRWQCSHLSVCSATQLASADTLVKCNDERSRVRSVAQPASPDTSVSSRHPARLRVCSLGQLASDTSVTPSLCERSSVWSARQPASDDKSVTVIVSLSVRSAVQPANAETSITPPHWEKLSVCNVAKPGPSILCSTRGRACAAPLSPPAPTGR